MTSTSDAGEIWLFDETVSAVGVGELLDVRVTSAGEAWMVGGTMNPTTGRQRGLVGRWTGAFEPLPSAEVAADVRLVGIDVTDSAVWAVGQSVDGTGRGRPYAERHPRSVGKAAGTVLAVPGGNRNGTLRGVVMLASDDGWAVGSIGENVTHSLVTHWDGQQWKTVPSPSPGTATNQLEAVAARSSTDVWAVGHSTDSYGPSSALVLHWDGTSWSHVPVPANGDEGRELLGVAVTGPDSVWVAGKRSLGAGQKAPAREAAIAMHWDGVTWHDLPPADTSANRFNSVTASSETEVWFGGYSESEPGPETAHIEHWDGTRLVPQEINRRGITVSEYPASGISAIAVTAERRVAVGWQILTSGADRMPAAIVGAGAPANSFGD
jgi:hypothetical protein